MLVVLGYLGLGILSDLMVTGFTISASRGREWSASILSFLIAVLNFYVLGKILVLDPSWVNALAYAAGNGIGCFCIMVASKKAR